MDADINSVAILETMMPNIQATRRGFLAHLGVAAVGPQSAFAEVERRGARTDRFVTRIDRNGVVGSFPGERQVRAVIVHAGDLPYELFTLNDGRIDATIDNAIVPRYQAIVRISHNELGARYAGWIVA